MAEYIKYSNIGDEIAFISSYTDEDIIYAIVNDDSKALDLIYDDLGVTTFIVENAALLGKIDMIKRYIWNYPRHSPNLINLVAKCAEGGHIEIFDYIVGLKLSSNMLLCLMNVAILKNNPELIKYVIDQGYYNDIFDGDLFIETAALNNKYDIVKYFVSIGCRTTHINLATLIDSTYIGTAKYIMDIDGGNYDDICKSNDFAIKSLFDYYYGLGNFNIAYKLSKHATYFDKYNIEKIVDIRNKTQYNIKNNKTYTDIVIKILN